VNKNNMIVNVRHSIFIGYINLTKAKLVNSETSLFDIIAENPKNKM